MYKQSYPKKEKDACGCTWAEVCNARYRLQQLQNVWSWRGAFRFKRQATSVSGQTLNFAHLKNQFCSLWKAVHPTSNLSTACIFFFFFCCCQLSADNIDIGFNFTHDESKRCGYPRNTHIYQVSTSKNFYIIIDNNYRGLSTYSYHLVLKEIHIHSMTLREDDIWKKI